MRVLDLAGSPESMGHLHGSTHADEIRVYTDDRVALAASRFWSDGGLDRSDVLEIAGSCLPAHEAHSPDLFAEMCGIAEGAGITPEEAVVVGGFTDFVDTVRAVVGGDHPDEVQEDDCTAVVVPDARADGAGFLAQTWDMHDSATEHVVMLRVRPDDAPAALVFSTTGCLGQIGMNEAGVCVGINNLVAADGRPGVMWTSVVRDLLTRETADEALGALLDADLAGGHSFLLFDATGCGFVVEAMPTARPYTTLDGEALVHTNHSLHPEAVAVEGHKPQDLMVNSVRRLERAAELTARPWVTAEDLMSLTRDPEAICQVSSEPYHIESSGGVVMRPRTRQLWAAWGLPSHNDYVSVPFAP